MRPGSRWPFTSFLLFCCKDVDARDKPGHDEVGTAFGVRRSGVLLFKPVNDIETRIDQLATQQI
jgi:hypothetical protein